MKSTKVAAILGDVSMFISLIAAIPYELGPAAEILPPAVKTNLVGVSAFCYFALRMIQRFTEGAPPPPEPGSYTLPHERPNP